MKKLRLEVEMLRVETFDTGIAARGGTVHGLSSYPDRCVPADSQDPAAYSCPGQTCAGDTCYESCVGCASAGCGTFGCNTNVDPTCSPRDLSCVALCVPPNG